MQERKGKKPSKLRKYKIVPKSQIFVYVFNNVIKIWEKKITVLQVEIDKSIIIVGNFTTPFSVIDETGRK